jgi:hypothetical protein
MFILAIRLWLFGNRIATTELVLDRDRPIVCNRIFLEKGGWAPEASNEAPDESDTDLFASARIRLMCGAPNHNLIAWPSKHTFLSSNNAIDFVHNMSCKVCGSLNEDGLATCSVSDRALPDSE